jgi:UDP-glucose 4-epimerase
LALEYLKKTERSDNFNLGNGNGFSVREVIECAGKVTGRMLGWNPKIPDLITIIETAWSWHLKPDAGVHS